MAFNSYIKRELSSRFIYTSPSWSWASCSGTASLTSGSIESNILCSTNDVAIHMFREDPTGKVVSGELTLDGVGEVGSIASVGGEEEDYSMEVS
jgi:hypothetical protein